MALKAVFFDVGETLVDEERWWRELATRAGLQPHVVWAALGVTIERGEEHDALWAHLGIERPDGWWEGLGYSSEDLCPDAIGCLERVRVLGLRVGIAGNQTRALEAWARDVLPAADVITSSASLGARKPDPGSSSSSSSSPDALLRRSRTSVTASTTTSCPRPRPGS